MLKMSIPICPYCNHHSTLVKGNVIYPHREDLHTLNFWKCLSCKDVYVGCKPNTTIPHGSLANSALRAARSEAHKFFDLLWKSTKRPQTARTACYAWLSEIMNLPPEQTHIGMFDIEQCKRVKQLVINRYSSKTATKR